MQDEPRRFVVERIAVPSWIVGACGGQGFTFAPLIGLRLAADIAVTFAAAAESDPVRGAASF
jgi:glycine/D-amino acid oxidase-like deaminating enzyme